MAQSLFQHGQITTTLPKAKNLRPVAERLITLAVKVRRRLADADRDGALRARRAIVRLLGDRSLIPNDHQAAYEAMSDAHRHKAVYMASGRRYRTGEPRGRLAFTAESVTHRLIETVAPRFDDRPGGYTRIIRLAKRRVGDHAPLAQLQLLGDEEAPVSLTKPARSARRRRTDARYATAIKASKAWAKTRRPKDRTAGGDGDEQEKQVGTDETSGAAPDNAGSSETPPQTDAAPPKPESPTAD